MHAVLDRLRPESVLGWAAVAVGFAVLVYGLSSATGASPPSVLAGFVAVGWVASVRWIYGLARRNRHVDETNGKRRPRVDDGPRTDETPSTRPDASRRGGSRGSDADADGASGFQRRSDEPEFESPQRE